MKPLISFRKALAKAEVLGHALRGPTWLPWKVICLAALGEPLTEEERAIFTERTGRQQPPAARVDELVAVVGRRGGKSRAMACLAAYIACCCKHEPDPGEQGVLSVIAPDSRQAGIILSYTLAFIEASPLLKTRIVGRGSDYIELTDNISIEVRAASFRRLRGPTFIAVIADEAAYWHSDDGASTNPDTEILNAVRPGLGTTGGMLIIASSPYARRGALWEYYSNYYGKDTEGLLTVHGATRDLNSRFKQSIIDKAMQEDAPKANAEYNAIFRTDLESYVSREAVTAVTVEGRYELAPMKGIRYHAFVDPAGGSGQDSMTLAIAHGEQGTAVLDAVREVKPPFSPERVTADFCTLLKSYRVSRVIGDHYAGEWAREPFRKNGVQYEPAADPKSIIYGDTPPLINSGKVQLLDHGRLFAQLTSLERRTGRVGKDTIDHPPKMHDDIANAVCGVLLMTGVVNTIAVDVVLADPRLKRQGNRADVWGRGPRPYQRTPDQLRNVQTVSHLRFGR